MSNKSTLFPISEPQHFSDYGFDPQIDYFQVLQEARKHKTEAPRPIDSQHFKLQKPITKDEFTNKKIKKKNNKKRWWKNALLFFKLKWAQKPNSSKGVHYGCSLRGSISGPVYITESRSGSSTPHYTTSRPSSGPLAGIVNPAGEGEVDIPYISLRELTMDQHHRITTSAMPIYLVT